MNNKYFKLIITFAVVLCLFCTSVTVFATVKTNDPEDTESVVESENDGTMNPGNLIVNTTGTTPSTTKGTTEPTTTEPTTEDEDDNTTTTKKKPSSTTTTKRNNNSGSNTTTRRNNETTRTTKPTENGETTDTTLPEGQFYVHLVLGNGEVNKKTIMKEPGKVSAPADPTWEGHIFEGWYTDAKFTKPWDFAKDIAKGEMTIYAKWSVDAASMIYTITVSDAVGGKITVNPTSAIAGTPIMVTVKPDDGKRLVEGSLSINGKKTNFLSFDMPAENVVISAQFEDIPVEVEKEEEKDNTLIIIIAGAGILVVALIIVGVVMLRRKNEIVVPEFDENGAVIIDDDDDIWVDESLVIEDAFPVVKNSTEQVDESVSPEADDFSAVEVDSAPTEKTKRLTEIVNGEEPSDVDNDVKLTDVIKDEEEKRASDISDIDFSLFE